MKTYNITINNLTFEELKETVAKLGGAATSAQVDVVNAATVMEAPAVATAPKAEVVKEAPKAAPAKRASKKAQEPVAPLAVPEAEEMEEVPSPYTAHPAEVKPTVEVAYSQPIPATPTVQQTAPAFDRAACIASIQSTVETLKNKLNGDMEQTRAFINDTYASLGMAPSPMTQLPDDMMAYVYKAFFNRVQGLVNGTLTGALV